MDREVYSASKIAFHPEALDKLRRAEVQAPVIVQWFPTNVCNQACSFCSYGSGPESIRMKVPNPASGLWKNQELMGSRDAMPRDKMLETLGCLTAMGVRCVEASGGGEPTIYPWFDELAQGVVNGGMEFALVTNGTRITKERAALLGALPFTWVRVSIDAGSAGAYMKTRNVPAHHYVLAWEAVMRLAQERRHANQVVGVGFVVDRDNWRGVYNACELAKAAGADNIRISASFTPEGVGRFDEHCAQQLPQLLANAKRDFEDATFKVNDLFQERWNNAVLGRQEYPFCYWKEIGCVIGADQSVYSCCSWAYNRMGLMGTVIDKTFTEMWFGEAAEWRARHDPRRDCRIHCLYEKRNVEALRLMGDRAYADQVTAGTPPGHLNFV